MFCMRPQLRHKTGERSTHRAGSVAGISDGPGLTPGLRLNLFHIHTPLHAGNLAWSPDCFIVCVTTATPIQETPAIVAVT